MCKVDEGLGRKMAGKSSLCLSASQCSRQDRRLFLLGFPSFGCRCSELNGKSMKIMCRSKARWSPASHRRGLLGVLNIQRDFWNPKLDLLTQKNFCLLPVETDNLRALRHLNLVSGATRCSSFSAGWCGGRTGLNSTDKSKYFTCGKGAHTIFLWKRACWGLQDFIWNQPEFQTFPLSTNRGQGMFLFRGNS